MMVVVLLLQLVWMQLGAAAHKVVNHTCCIDDMRRASTAPTTAHATTSTAPTRRWPMCRRCRASAVLHVFRLRGLRFPRQHAPNTIIGRGSKAPVPHNSMLLMSLRIVSLPLICIASSSTHCLRSVRGLRPTIPTSSPLHITRHHHPPLLFHFPRPSLCASHFRSFYRLSPPTRPLPRLLHLRVAVHCNSHRPSLASYF